MLPFHKLLNSSTFWTGLLLPIAHTALQSLFKIAIPWELTATAIGAQGLRNAGEHIADGMVAQAEVQTTTPPPSPERAPEPRTAS